MKERYGSSDSSEENKGQTKGNTGTHGVRSLSPLSPVQMSVSNVI